MRAECCLLNADFSVQEYNGDHPVMRAVAFRGRRFLRATSVPAMRLLLHREIGDANFDHRALPSALGARRILRRVHLVRWLFRPHSENASTKCSDPGVITKEDASGLERIIGPSIVRKTPAAIRRTCQYHDLLAILRVASAVIKDHIHRAIRGVYG